MGILDIIKDWAKNTKENPEMNVDLSKWSADNMSDMTHLFEEAERQKENRENFKNLIVNIPFEHRSFNSLLGNAFTEINLSKNNEFLIINDITSEQEIKLNNMLDGFKNKVGTEWLLSFVDFIKEVNDMKLHQRTIEEKNTSKEDFEAKYKIIDKKSLEDLEKNKLDSVEDMSHFFDGVKGFPKAERQQEKKEKQDSTFNNIIDETKKTLTDKSNELNDLKKELDDLKFEMKRLKEGLRVAEVDIPYYYIKES